MRFTAFFNFFLEGVADLYATVLGDLAERDLFLFILEACP